MLSLTQFVDKLNSDNQFTRIEVLIDTKLYPNTFGINVRPIQLTLWNNTTAKLTQKILSESRELSAPSHIRDVSHCEAMSKLANRKHITAWQSQAKLVMSMQDIINKFEGICYIRVNESTHRRLSREPSMLVINTTPKTFNGYTYYDYRISKLFLLDELTRYNKIYESSHEVMKRYKELNEPTTTDEQQGSELIE